MESISIFCRITNKILCLLLVLAFIFTGSGCSREDIFAYTEDSGNTCANAVMGNGVFAYSNDFIYIASDTGVIKEYDIQSGKTVTLDIGVGEFPTSLFVATDYLCYLSNRSLYRITKDGKQKESIPGIEGCHLYAEGNDYYYLTNKGESLYRGNFETNERTLLYDKALSYYVDDSYIYVVCDNEDDVYMFLRSPKDRIEFETIELSFYPIAMTAKGDDLFFTSGGEGVRWQVIHYRDGVETTLPIYSYFYQVLDNTLIYADDATFNGRFDINAYDLETGEITPLMENVLEFSILEDRYICAACYKDNTCWWVMLDWQTGEMTYM